MRVYNTLINQIKNDQTHASSLGSGFGDVLDKLENMLGEAQKLNEKFKNNEQISPLSEAINEAKDSIEALNNEQKDDLAATFKKLEAQAKKDEEMFKTFDFMSLMNQLIYGTNSEDEKNKIYQKMQEIAKSVK